MKYICKICKNKTLNTYRNVFDDRHGYPGRFNIYRCTNCGFMQTEPQLTFRKLTSVYTNYYPKRDANIEDVIKSSRQIPSKKVIFNNGWETTCHFQTEKGQKVLDVGCGTCQSLLEIKKLGGEPWGIDPDKNSERVAKKLNLKFHLGTIHNCKFPKKSFDLITASQVLEHEGDPLKFLSECKKLLKPGGKIILSFPNTGSFYNKIWGRNWLHWHIPYHLNHFNKKSLKILIENVGLEIYSLKTVTPNLWTVLQIRSYLAKVKPGVRNKMWDGESESTTKRKQSLIGKVLFRLIPYINNLLVINKLLDKLMLGESFVLTLYN